MKYNLKESQIKEIFSLIIHADVINSFEKVKDSCHDFFYAINVQYHLSDSIESHEFRLTIKDDKLNIYQFFEENDWSGGEQGFDFEIHLDTIMALSKILQQD